MEFKLIISSILLSSVAAQNVPYFETFLEQIGQSLTRFSNSIQGPEISEPRYDNSVEEYDFVVIGAGSAGCVVANRLSEIHDWKILLLEAGVPENPVSQIPQVSQILQATRYSWQYQTVPQKSGCLGMIDNICNQASGKGLGGGGSISDSIYTRGSRQDYDIWASMGNPGWSYEEVLPYFKKAEDVHLPIYDEDYHGIGGPNNVELEKNPSRIRKPFLRAVEELNYKILDYNGKNQIGFNTPQVTTLRGRRNSISRIYLERIRDRKNLVIKTSSFVKKINLNGNEAQEVIYTRNGKTLIAKARKEIILSAGVFNSPKILQLSGVGPKNYLESLQIEVQADLPVGENLRDHIVFLGLNFIHNKKSPETNYLNSFAEWLLRGEGPLTSCGIDVLGYLNSGVSSEDPNHADFELALIPVALNQGYSLIKPVTNLREDIYDSVWKETEGKDSFAILVILSRAKSKGNVRIKSKNPYDNPLIDPKYLDNDDDLEIVLSGIKKALQISNTTSFAKINFTINSRKVFGCEDFDFGTDNYWRCAIRRLQISSLHPTGTNKMGPRGDSEAVVDAKLKVHGIRKLRIVDASVIPNANTAHMMGPVVMLAEKASDIIKDDWEKL